MSLKQRFINIKAEIRQQAERVVSSKPNKLPDGGYEYILIDDEDRLTITLQGEHITDVEFFTSIIETVIMTDDEMKAETQ